MKRMMTGLGLMQVFVALLLVVVIMLFSTFSVYRNSISGIYEEVSQKNALMMQSTVQAFDNSFRVVNNLIHSIETLPGTESLRSSAGELNDMSIAYSMIDHLANLTVAYDFIEEVAVAYKDSDFVVISRGTNRFDYFFNEKYAHETYNANYWRNYMSGHHAYKVFPVSSFVVRTGEYPSRNQQKPLLVVTGGNKYQTSDKFVIVLIDLEALFRHLSQSAGFSGGSVMILDHERNILFSTDGDWDLMDAFQDIYANGASELTLTQDSYEYRILKSSYNDFIYMERLPYQFSNMAVVDSANKNIMWTAAACAVLLSLLLSVYLHAPVKRILKQLGGGNSKGDDFRKILSGIVKLQAENEEYRGRMQAVDAELRKTVFLQLINGHPHGEEHEAQLQTYYADLYQSPFFVMALVHMGALPESRVSEWTVEERERWLERELLKDGLQAKAFHIEGMQFVAMLRLDAVQGSVRLIRQLKTSFARMRQETLEASTLWVCLSEAYASTVPNCRHAYESVVEAARYRKIDDTSVVIEHGSMQYRRMLYYPVEKMERMSHLLVAGKLQETRELIEETIRESVEQGMHYHQLIHLAHSVFFYLLGHADRPVQGEQAFYELEKSFMEQCKQARHPDEIEQALLHAVDQLKGQQREENEKKLSPSFIAQYIEQHYRQSLYLDDMAAAVGTSPKYFSTYFKKHFGVNYIEYLNKVRLTHAKEMLRESQLSVAEIGERTGYLNASTFTSTFKKYVGISPSEYRKKKSYQFSEIEGACSD